MAMVCLSVCLSILTNELIINRLQEEEKNADYHNSSQEQKLKMEEFDKIINNLEKQIQKKKEDLECVISLLIEIEKVVS